MNTIIKRVPQSSGVIPVEPAPAMPAPAAPMQPPAGGFARPAPESRQTNAIEELYCKYMRSNILLKKDFILRVILPGPLLKIEGCTLDLDPSNPNFSWWSRSWITFSNGYREYGRDDILWNLISFGRTKDGKVYFDINYGDAVLTYTWIRIYGPCGNCCKPRMEYPHYPPDPTKVFSAIPQNPIQFSYLGGQPIFSFWIRTKERKPNPFELNDGKIILDDCQSCKIIGLRQE